MYEAQLWFVGFDLVSDTLGGRDSATVTVTGDQCVLPATARTDKQDVLDDLASLRASSTDKQDGKKLDDAIEHDRVAWSMAVNAGA